MSASHDRPVVLELTPELWPAFEELFDNGSVSGRCWCMYWRIGAEYRRRAATDNRDSFRRIVADGPPPGLLAFDGDTAIGWCQLTPRDELPVLDRRKRFRRPDDAPVWSISCFYVRKGWRKRGVATALVDAAVDLARRHGAAGIEAYPLDAGLTPSSSHTGYVSTFERAGFAIVARHAPSQPVMRKNL